MENRIHPSSKRKLQIRSRVASSISRLASPFTSVSRDIRVRIKSSNSTTKRALVWLPLAIGKRLRLANRRGPLQSSPIVQLACPSATPHRLSQSPITYEGIRRGSERKVRQVRKAPMDRNDFHISPGVEYFLLALHPLCTDPRWYRHKCATWLLTSASSRRA